MPTLRATTTLLTEQVLWGPNTTASKNTAIGRDAMFNNTTGTENTALGYNCLDAATTGVDNTAVGP